MFFIGYLPNSLHKSLMKAFVPGICYERYMVLFCVGGHTPATWQVAALEELIWQTLDQLEALSQRTGRPRLPLPPPLLALRPAPRRPSRAGAVSGPVQGSAAEPGDAGAGGAAAPELRLRDDSPRYSSVDSPEGSGRPGGELQKEGPAASEEQGWDASSGSGYPRLRRAQRLVYQLASLLVDSFDVAEGRQVRGNERRA